MDIISLLENGWSVIEQAPFAALILLALGGVAGFFTGNMRFSGVIDALRVRLEDAENSVEDKKSTISSLEEQLSLSRGKLEALSKATHANTDPDAIFQREMNVGTLRGVEIKLSESRVFIAQIHGLDRLTSTDHLSFEPTNSESCDQEVCKKLLTAEFMRE